MNHLVIMKNPWFGKIITGKKTIESRVSKRKIIPFEKVNRGDILYFKESGQKYVSFCAEVQHVEYYQKPIHIYDRLRHHAKEICIDDKYIESKKYHNYLSLFWLGEIQKLGANSFYFKKKDQRAWICNIEPRDTILGEIT